MNSKRSIHTKHITIAQKPREAPRLIARSRSRRLPKARISLGRPGIELTQIPVAEWDNRRDHWIIWLNYDPMMRSGTYVELRKDGSAYRLTMDEDGTVMSTIALDNNKSKADPRSDPLVRTIARLRRGQ